MVACGQKSTYASLPGACPALWWCSRRRSCPVRCILCNSSHELAPIFCGTHGSTTSTVGELADVPLMLCYRAQAQGSTLIP